MESAFFPIGYALVIVAGELAVVAALIFVVNLVTRPNEGTRNRRPPAELSTEERELKKVA